MNGRDLGGQPGVAPADAESRALRLGLWLSIVFAVAPCVVTLLSDSQIMLLEAKYGIVDAVLAYMTLVAHRKIQQPADGAYHYGYAKYEPMVNVMEGIMVLMVCMTTVLAGAQDLVHPEDIDNSGLVIGYTFASTVVCLGTHLFLKRQARLCHSELLRADAQVWVIDGMLSLGACVAFVVMRLLGGTSWRWATPYVDPGLAVIVALAMLPYAKDLLQESMRDLLDANPGGETQDKIVSLVEAHRTRYQLPGSAQVRLRKAGRRLFVAIRFPDDPSKTREELRAVRCSLQDEIIAAFRDVDLHLYFDRTAAPAGAVAEAAYEPEPAP